MKTRILTAATLIIAIANLSPVQAQMNGTRCHDPYPTPMPIQSDYFLGVYTSTVPVDSSHAGPQPLAASGGYQTYVAPGYGEQVYGQRISQVIPNSPAFHAGLEPGDIILDANGSPVDTKNDLAAAIRNSHGYLQMKVLDRRTNNIVWVVAQTNSQNSGPVIANQNQQHHNSGSYHKHGNGFGNGNAQIGNQPLSNQIGSAIQSFGGRRAPVRRQR